MSEDRDRTLDPQAEALLETVEELGLPPTAGLSPSAARDRLTAYFAEQEHRPVGRVEEFSIPGPGGALPVRLYEPDAEGPHPLTVFFHGGGWTAGDLDTHDNVCAALVDEAGTSVLSVDYRLAPEDPFPAALHDCYAAVEWATEFGHRVKCDPDRVAVAGDSAGGNLAAAVSLLARDRRRGVGFRDEPGEAPDIVHQSLIYPAVNSPAGETFDSYEENALGYFLERPSMEYYYANYVPEPADARNEYLAPLLARDLSGLPPATVLTAGFDPLRDEGEAYAERLEAAGVPVHYEEFPGMIHGFVSMTDDLDRAADGLELLGRELREAFE